MGTDEGVQPGPFVVHVDKAMMSKVMLASWSPKHELLAVVFSDKPMSLYRLNWEKLWNVSPDIIPADTFVSALCSSPDGSLLAAGLSNGSTVLLNVEDGAVVHRWVNDSRLSSASQCNVRSLGDNGFGRSRL